MTYNCYLKNICKPSHSLPDLLSHPETVDEQSSVTETGTLHHTLQVEVCMFHLKTDFE